VYIKYKCGPAPEVTHFYVVLYGDRLLARPIEVWQVGVDVGVGVDARMWVWVWVWVWV
jgi:nephrocystin-4